MTDNDANATEPPDQETGEQDTDAEEDTDATGEPEAPTSEPDAGDDGLELSFEELEQLDIDPDSAIVERVRAVEPERIAEKLLSLQERADEAEDALADAESRAEELEAGLKRKAAEFSNYKKRMQKRREQEKARATEDLVERLVPVRDNLVRALDQDDDIDIRDGVGKTLESFDRVLDAEDVVRIEPEQGAAVDPTRHEVLLQVESDAPPGTVDSVQRPGYEMGGKILRTAQVTVSAEE